MLKYALDYTEELKRVDRQAWLNPDMKWYYNSAWNKEIEVSTDDWNYIQMVSADDDGNVLGYFHVAVDEIPGNLQNLGVINYGNKCNYTFASDFYRFLYYLFIERGFQRLEWSVTIGNPIEKMYDRFCKKVGGNIVGITHKSAVLMNRQLVDEKIYEVFQEGVQAYVDKHGITLEKIA